MGRRATCIRILIKEAVDDACFEAHRPHDRVALYSRLSSVKTIASVALVTGASDQRVRVAAADRCPP